MNNRSFFDKFRNDTFAVQYHHLIAFFIVLWLTPKSGFWFDLHDWARWSVYTFEHGLSQIYHSDTNYMPFYLHLLYFFGQIKGSVEAINHDIYQIKYAFLIFDFGAGIALVYALRKFVPKLNSYTAYLLIFNIAYWYETVLWGQLDSVPTTIVILGFIMLWQGNLLWAAFFCTWSIYAKLQAIIFIPFFAILLVHQLFLQKDKTLILKMLGVSVLTQLWLLIPFIVGGTFNNFVKVAVESVGFFPKVSWNAYNIWYLFTPSDPKEMFDTLPFFLGFTYKKWGFMLFFAFSALSLLPLFAATAQYIIKKKQVDKHYLTLFWLVAGTVSVVFFFFNTQMHERYAFPALVMFFAYMLLSRKFLIYVLVSIAHFINVDAVYQQFHLNIIKPELISALYCLILLLCFYEIYQFTAANFPMRRWFPLSSRLNTK